MFDLGHDIELHSAIGLRMDLGQETPLDGFESLAAHHRVAILFVAEKDDQFFVPLSLAGDDDLVWCLGLVDVDPLAVQDRRLGQVDRGRLARIEGRLRRPAVVRRSAPPSSRWPKAAAARRAE
jgi:hypothetical protein